MEQIFQNKGLSTRAYHKILCVARTIADMEEVEEIQQRHLAEAIGYRLPEHLLRGIRG